MGGRVPDGFNGFRRTTLLDSSFDVARAALFGWQVQLRSGVRVRASSPTVEQDAVAVMSIGFGPFRIGAPVRVIDIVDDEDVAAFTYGTLPGHPECGEEHFCITRHDGRVQFTVAGFSRPESGLARLGSPVAAMVQRRITARYLRSLQTRQ